MASSSYESEVLSVQQVVESPHEAETFAHVFAKLQKFKQMKLSFKMAISKAHMQCEMLDLLNNYTKVRVGNKLEETIEKLDKLNKDLQEQIQNTINEWSILTIHAYEDFVNEDANIQILNM